MKDFWTKVLVSITSAAIVANFAILWQLNTRVAAIETTLRLNEKFVAANQ